MHEASSLYFKRNRSTMCFLIRSIFSIKLLFLCYFTLENSSIKNKYASDNRWKVKREKGAIFTSLAKLRSDEKTENTQAPL